MKQRAYFLLLSVLVGASAQAEWVLDSEHSAISFVSTKAINVAEVHKFTELSGGVDEDGQVTLSISLASVDSGIVLRDERMREMLFETDKFSLATVSAKVDTARLDKLEPGESMRTAIEGSISLHGETRTIPIDLLITRAGDHQLLVASEKPVVVNAPQFRLSEGVERLREVAGLPSISTAVPVTFILTFSRD